jgi:hypothetical protein
MAEIPDSPKIEFASALERVIEGALLHDVAAYSGHLYSSHCPSLHMRADIDGRLTEAGC